MGMCTLSLNGGGPCFCATTERNEGGGRDDGVLLTDCDDVPTAVGTKVNFFLTWGLFSEGSLD